MAKPKSKSTYKTKRLSRGPIDYARNVRWKWDCDYLDKLSPEEKAWFEKFNEAYIGADSKALADWPTKARKETYQQKNAANRDLYAITNAGDLLQFPDKPIDPTDPSLDKDWAATPLHLDDPLYRELRRELREAIDTRPVDVVRVANLRRKLEIFVEPEED